MGALDHWDWQATFAEMGAEFAPAVGHADPAVGHADPAAGHADPGGGHADLGGGHSDPGGGWETAPGAGFPASAAEAVAAVARLLLLDRVFRIHATRTVPVRFTAPPLLGGGRPVHDRPAWVVLILGEHRVGALAVAGDDPLAALRGGAAVIEAVVDAASLEILASAVEPVAREGLH